MQVTYEITILELHDRSELSVRAYNVCRDLDIFTVGDLIEFHRINGGFKSAKNCGDKTNDELVGIISQYAKTEGVQNRREIKGFRDSTDQEIFDIYTKTEFNKLSVRAKNAILNLVGGAPPKFENLRTEFISGHFDPLSLQNVGVLTSKEIETFHAHITQFYYSIQNETISERNKKKLQFYSITGFDVTDEGYLDLFIEHRFPILLFITDYLRELFSLNEVDLFIVQNHLLLLQERYTLDDIALKFSLSRERIRQRSIAVFENIDRRSNALIQLLPYCNPIFDAIKLEHIVPLHSYTVPELLAETKNLNPLFSSFFLGILLSDRFYSFNRLDKFRKPRDIQYYYLYEDVRSVKGAYLINKAILPKEQLLSVYSSVLSKFCERRKEDEIVKIPRLTSVDNIPDIDHILARVINHEFEMNVTGGCIIYPRNTNKLIFEYAAEALAILNRPAHISEILEEVVKLHPDYDSDESALRGSIGKYKSIFIYFGRSSTYGLRTWETKKKNMKGGTIRSIIAEYLKDELEPKHISEILNHLRRFRDTTYNSVVTNLKLDTKSKFKFYGNGFVGLSDSAYNNTAFGLEFKNADEIDWEKIINVVF